MEIITGRNPVDYSKRPGEEPHFVRETASLRSKSLNIWIDSGT
ncbi:hypothetical protein CASFOL_001700 [Castilleja foliolosa]|uniref:Uncharacterized protein n=1 Tax=Castilleja foliolosa TaxID=1961234 RepID=A0ABD3ECT4_9LAMI